MSDSYVDTSAESRTVEVRVIRKGRLVGTELCESEEQADLAVRSWMEFDGVQCQVADLSTRWRDGDGHADLLEGETDDYPDELELERSEGDSMRFGD
ncbi:MAG TPA: hypothetical protein VFH58_14480 [Acidimicrobiales bacterium]|nr:hypothetical protein [Acidimicrobiales bacterium]